MAGFDENVAIMGEWMPRGSPSSRTLFTMPLVEEKNSKPVLERELSLNHGQIGLEDGGKKDSSQTGFQLPEEKPSFRGGLGERIAARAGFNAPRLNTENIRSADFSFNPDVRSPCLTISSPGLSPATLLESPVFLSNPLVQPSPTTGKFSFLPVNNNNTLSSGPSDKTKDDFFDDIGKSFTFQPVSRSSSSFIPGASSKGLAIPQDSFPNMEMSIEYDNSHRPQTMEGVQPGSQNTESVNLQTDFHGTSAERHNNGNETDPGKQRTFDAMNTGAEIEDPQDEEQRRNGGDMVAGGAPADDGYNWRKYGQKQVKGSEYPRSYYKCTHPNCQVKKKVERSREGHITEIIYKGAHNHPKPPPNRRSAIGSSNMGLDIQIDGTEQTEQQSGNGRDPTWASTQQAGNTENVEATSPTSTGFEYGNQSGIIQGQGGTQFESGDAAAAAAVVDGSSTFSNDEDEDDRGTHGSVSLGYDGEGDESESKRRKLEAYATEMSGATRAIREPRVVVQTTSDVDILDDGYRWRKYGQKVVKGNPNPRSYYKCTAPGCTVRKHVERASHDLKSVITTYEGKHNHDVPAARNSSHGGTGGSSGGSGTLQAATAAQSHGHQSELRHRFERPVSTNPPFGCPFGFQPQLGPPPGFSFGMNQPGLAGLAMPGLAFGQGKLPVLPMHPYLAQQPPVSEPGGLMLPRGEPKIEPMSETGLGLSGSSSIYRQLMSRLPQI